jgi:hypothetical protein
LLKALLTNLPALDWRLTCEAGLLFTRTRFRSRRWTPQLPQFRDRSDRPLHQFHSRSQEQAVQAQWIQPGGVMRHGHRRRRLQILQQNEGDLACECHSRRRDGVPHHRWELACVRLAFHVLMFTNRSGFLHHGDTSRGLHIQRRRAYAIRRGTRRYLPLFTCQYWIRSVNDQGIGTAAIRAGGRYFIGRRHILGYPIITYWSSNI